MLSIFDNINVEIYGESHGDRIGVRLGGIPQGIKIDIDALQAFVNRRRASTSAHSTPRIEKDIVEFESGIVNDITNGDTINAFIINTNVKRGDYASLRGKPRPGHADYVAYMKYGLDTDMSGGGKFSGRLTAAMCIAGGIAKQIIQEKGIKVGAYISEIGTVISSSYKISAPNIELIENSHKMSIPLLYGDKLKDIEFVINQAREEGDSVGGVIECVAFGVPAGLGETLYEGIEGRIASSIFAIPAIKGVEFGSGFDISRMRGSEANDELYYKNSKVTTLTNHNGGINGGITNGMEITLRVAIKPTPSISKLQHTIDMIKRENTIIEINGRHDTCIAVRAVPCVESAVALVLLDCILDK